MHWEKNQKVLPDLRLRELIGAFVCKIFRSLDRVSRNGTHDDIFISVFIRLNPAASKRVTFYANSCELFEMATAEVFFCCIFRCANFQIWVNYFNERCCWNNLAREEKRLISFLQTNDHFFRQLPGTAEMILKKFASTFDGAWWKVA